jgi:hypothetical protein
MIDALPDAETNPLYSIAEEEIASVIPPQLGPHTKIRLDHVRDLMLHCWLRGASWAAEKKQ